MLHKIMTAVMNSGLLAVVLLLLAGPLVLGSMLITNQTGSLGAATSQPSIAGGQADDVIFNVVPNTTDFSQYAAFADQPQVSRDTYQTSVTFTAFSAQIASYNGLMSIENTTDQVQRFTVEVGKISGELSRSRVWVTLAPEGQTTTNLLTQAAKIGDQQLTVADTAGFHGSHIVVGTTSIPASSAGATQLSLGQPLNITAAVGEKVYFGPAYFMNSITPSLDKTQTIELQPHTRATVDLIVATDSGEPATNQAVLPLVILRQP